ncbi:MAG: ribosome maturation factor RimM [Acidobacteriia bacterium]|nr:ribosome maturation factor RimM [Terriglobia bacterium]
MNSDVKPLLREMEEGEITLALVRKTQGRQGEVAAEILTDFPERFHQMKRVRLVKTGEAGSWKELEKVWFHKQAVILKFSGIETITDAEALVGSEVRIPQSEALPLPRNHHYIFELVGCRVVEDHSSREIGRVKEFLEAGGNNLLALETSHGELLVPFAEEICFSVDVQRREIRVRLPEGLFELNR